VSLPSIRASFPKGLYVVLDPQVSKGRSLVEILMEAAGAGARLFQYRDKLSPGGHIYRLALQLRRAAEQAGALFLVNDRCDVALAVDADGVHLGQGDLPVALARRLLGHGKIIGVSTHRPAEVREATVTGADYLGVGPIFQTGTKPDHEPVVGIEGLRQIQSLTPLPVFAIGGITLECLPAVRGAGADGVAVISAIVGSSDVAGTVRAFLRGLA
jgi:thiamine-phosphate pyrophosphorylase